MNSIYKYLQEYGLVIVLIILISTALSIPYFIPDPPQPYTTTINSAAREFISNCNGLLNVKEVDGMFIMECKETK